MQERMTISQARKELRRPLVFGDDRQIKARDVLRSVADCVETIQKCSEDHLRKGSLSRLCNEIRNCECVSRFYLHDSFNELETINAALKQLGILK